MNKFFKYVYIALFGALTVGLSSCTDDYEYQPASKTDLGGNVFLQSQSGTTLAFLPTAEQSFSFTVLRVDSTAAEQVGLTSSNSKFTVPSTISFAAGQKSTQVTVNFDISQGTTETTAITISGDTKFYYGTTTLNYTITRYRQFSATYTSQGMEFQYETPVYEIGGGSYIIPADATQGYEYDLTFTISDSSVVVLPQAAWNHASYGAVYVMGNLDDDASADGSGSGVAGTFDSETGLVRMFLYHYVPGLGSFGTFEDDLIINFE